MLKMKFMTMITLFILSALSQAATYSMAKINLGYGKLNVGSGGGDLLVTTDAQYKLASISIDVRAGFFGMTTPIKYSENMYNLSKGSHLEFYMDGGRDAVMTIKAMAGFDENGGKLQISVLKKEGYTSSIVQLALDSVTKKFKVLMSNSVIGQININMRGYSIPDMYVGWYEMK